MPFRVELYSMASNNMGGAGGQNLGYITPPSLYVKRFTVLISKMYSTDCLSLGI